MKETGKYKLVIFVLILVNVLIIAFWWLFYTPDGRDRDRKHGNWQERQRHFWEQTLNLDEDQKQAFERLDKAHKTQLFNMNNQVDSLKREIGKAILAGEQNIDDIDRLFGQIANGRAAIDTSIYHHFGRLRKICRPNQEAAFDSMMNDFINRKNRGPGMNRNMPEPTGEKPPREP